MASPSMTLLLALATTCGDDPSIEDSSASDFVAALKKDLEDETARITVLQDWTSMLFVHEATREAVVQVLRDVSWEVFDLLTGLLENPGGNDPATLEDLAEALLNEMAELLSAKELHIIALEHLNAYNSRRTLRTLLSVLRRSTERMEPKKRPKFLVAALQPVLDTTKRLADGSDSTFASHDGHDCGTVGCGENGACEPICGIEQGTESEDSFPVATPAATGYETSSSSNVTAAAEAAEAALDFIRPLFDQAKTHRGSSVGDSDRTVKHSARDERELASDRMLATIVSFVLSSLAQSAEKSVCSAVSARNQRVAAAEDALVEILVACPVIDLEFVLSHYYRSAHAHMKKPLANSGAQIRGHARQRIGDLSLVADLAWDIAGVSCLAYLVACEPKLRDRILPLVWSHRMFRHMLLPYAETLMRHDIKTLASKGLQLACCVGEGLGPMRREDGPYPLAWRPAEDIMGREKMRATSDSPFDWYDFDLATYLQTLIDVLVTCPVAALRARGHAAMRRYVAAINEEDRFALLCRLIERCPWPNATGLLLDIFRHEVDHAVRAVTTTFGPGKGSNTDDQNARCGRSRGKLADTPVDVEDANTCKVACSASSFTFASSAVGDFVCQQLERACHQASPATMLMDLDTRTGALALARFAYALDRGAAAGRLGLLKESRRNKNSGLVQNLLDKLGSSNLEQRSRHTVLGENTLERKKKSSQQQVDRDFFRLFLLQDVAQECLRAISATSF